MLCRIPHNGELRARKFFQSSFYQSALAAEFAGAIPKVDP
jgi:hypothetical protein